MSEPRYTVGTFKGEASVEDRSRSIVMVIATCGDRKYAEDIVYALNLQDAVPGGLSLTIACPSCGEEVDVTEAKAL